MINLYSKGTTKFTNQGFHFITNDQRGTWQTAFSIAKKKNKFF